MNHLNRSMFLAMCAASSAAQMRSSDYGLAAWGAVVFMGLVYPHLLYWRARWADHQLNAEFTNLMVDAALAGVWVAALGFPLWISFAFCFSCLINLTVFKGWAGTLQAAAVCALAGLGVVLLVPDWHHRPDTTPLATALSMFAVSSYLLVVANAAYQRAVKLHQIRRRLRDGETALSEANQSLQRRIREVEVLQSRLEDQANHDALTGLFNRRYYELALERLWHDCMLRHQPLSVLMIDLDHFKNINDRYGHAAGDDVLRALADLLTDFSRGSDVICRLGGEEFIVLLPGMPTPVAMERAELYRRRFRELRVRHEAEVISGTLSIGVAILDAEATQVLSPEQLVASADAALYRAKGNGRDRVEVVQRP